MKIRKLIQILLLIILLIGGFILFKVIGPASKKPEKGFFFVKTGSTVNEVKSQLLSGGILESLTWFNLATKLLPIKQARPGKYKIDDGMSVLSIVRMLRNGRQTPVDFVVTKIRTKEQLAAKMGNAYEFDSTVAISFLNNNDSLKKYALDTNTIMAAVQPLTYKSRWNTTPGTVFERFYDAYKKFWTKERVQQAEQLNLTPLQVVTLASIIDEETNNAKEKGIIASVYMNRIAKGMMLQADPTVKFALKDFGIKRILNKHLAANSPFNTYKNKGLPPGPICTPQLATIDSILKSPKTEYIYFVASPAFNGTHVFTTNYEDHMKHARAYQQALNEKFGKIADTAK